MSDYRKMYMKLFIAVSEAMELLEKATLEAEEIYISRKEIEYTLLDFKNKTQDDERN